VVHFSLPSAAGARFHPSPIPPSPRGNLPPQPPAEKSCPATVRPPLASGRGAVICIIHQTRGKKKRNEVTEGGGRRIKREREGKIRAARRAGHPALPDSPWRRRGGGGDASPALLPSTVIFYWVYDVINLIAGSAHAALIVSGGHLWPATRTTPPIPLPGPSSRAFFRAGSADLPRPRYPRNA